MKQIFQDLKSGETRVEEVLCSQGASGELLISTQKSLVSVGTEQKLGVRSEWHLLKGQHVELNIKKPVQW